MPKSLGGPGEPNKTNPEELFAAGYGACFQGAMAATASSLKLKLPKDSVVTCKVHLVGSAKDLDMGLRVDMVVKAEGMEKGDLERLVEKTLEVCPYSRATKGNVTTNVEIA